MEKRDQSEIHPTAVVSSKAEIGRDVKIGPFSLIGDHVSIGNGTVIASNVVVSGHTVIGERNLIYQFSSIGTAPQDIGYSGEDTRVIIGNDNIIREYVTINRATTKEEWKTVVGSDNYFMAYVHIAHDCIVGDKVVMANMATLGGHVKVGDHAVLGGAVVAHQSIRIGDYAFLGGTSGILQDVPPFMLVSGHRAVLYGINQKGLVREGFPNHVIDVLKKAYRIIWRNNLSIKEGIRQARNELEPFPELDLLLKFLDDSKRGIVRQASSRKK